MPRRHISQREAHELSKEVVRLRRQLQAIDEAARSTNPFHEPMRLASSWSVVVDVTPYTAGQLSGFRLVDRHCVFVANPTDDRTKVILRVLRNVRDIR